MIQIDLQRVDGDFHMVATNEEGIEVHLDASPGIGGTGKGMRPMQMLLASLAGCSTIDVINILRKQKQDIINIRTVIKGIRDDEAVPAVFKSISVHFIVEGNIEIEKVQKAAALSIDKYCSVAAMLINVDITHTSEVIR